MINFNICLPVAFIFLNQQYFTILSHLKTHQDHWGLHFQIKKIINELNCSEQISAQKAQKCSIIFLHNATCFSESLQASPTNNQKLQFRTASS